MNILVTGGAGYVGSALIPALLEKGHQVTVYDLYLYGKDVFQPYQDDTRLTEVVGDLRDTAALREALTGCDTVIHLACISNDPSFELDETLGKQINYDCFEPFVLAAKEAGVRRFINASSSSVYGIKEAPNVHEEMPLEPLTGYSECKALCEEVVHKHDSAEFCTVTVRPATVCGYAPRQRLDLIVNILTNHAITNGKIKVFGGEQLRPNIHIKDMVRCYLALAAAPEEVIRNQVFNAGGTNHSVTEIAEIVRGVIGDEIEIEFVPTDDQRSYHICSQKIIDKLGFQFEYSIEDAVTDLKRAFVENKLPDSMSDSKYFNIQRMKELDFR